MRLLAALAFCCASALAQDFFIQLSDTQMGMFANNANMLQDEANYRFAAASINRLRPAFVVITGDLVNKPGDPEQVAKFMEITATIVNATPVHTVPGNHDVDNEPTPASLAAYRKLVGKDYYTFDALNFRGIVLNSSLIQKPGKAPDEAAKQEAWLVDQLKRAQAEAKPVFIFQHISYFLETANEPDQYFNIPYETRRRFLALYHQYGVKHVFAGHYHRNAYGRDGDLEMVTSGPVSVPLGKDQSGLRVIRVNGAEVHHRYYELGSIPNAIPRSGPLPVFPTAP